MLASHLCWTVSSAGRWNLPFEYCSQLTCLCNITFNNFYLTWCNWHWVNCLQATVHNAKDHSTRNHSTTVHNTVTREIALQQITIQLQGILISLSNMFSSMTLHATWFWTNAVWKFIVPEGNMSNMASYSDFYVSDNYRKCIYVWGISFTKLLLPWK